MDGEGDTKPDVGAAGGAGADDSKKTITLRVKDQDGAETSFKVKRTTKMAKVFDAYAARKGVTVASLRFTIDGDRVADTETPDSLDLQDQDLIDVFSNQVGGWSS